MDVNDSDNDTGIDGQLELDADMDPVPDPEQDAEPDFGLDIEPGIDLDLWPDTELGLDFGSQYGEGPGMTGGIAQSLDQSIDLDADLSDEIEPGPETEALPGSDEAEEGGLSEEELALLLAKRRKRQRVLILVAVIAWVLVILTFMFVNGWGPFAVNNTPPEPAPEETTPVTDAAVSQGWATAGVNYQDLVKLIDNQTTGFQNGSQTGDLPVSPGQDIGASVDSGMGVSFTDSSNADLILDATGKAETVQEISEADVIKTDGNYIYAINSKNLFIVKTGGGDMNLISKIAQPPMNESQVYFEMYVSGDRLIAIRHGYNPVAEKDSSFTLDGTKTYIDYPINGNIMDTSIDIFDISNPEAPARLHTLTQSGDYSASCMVNGYLYLITTYYDDVSQINTADPRTFVPLFARDGEQYTPDESEIYLPLGTEWPCFTVISGIDANASGNFISRKSVYGDEGAIYMSQDAVYLAHTMWEDAQNDYGTEYVVHTNWSETVLSKLTADSGQVEPGAQTLVPGYVLNQLAMDEYQGVIRIVTANDQSTWYGFKDDSVARSSDEISKLPESEIKTTNALYTLDNELQPLGSALDLAPGDRVYSCRFMGDIAYLVTYRQTAPLISVDLSVPSAPRVSSGQETTALPEYLQPYSDGRLFGLGRNTDPDTGIMRDIKMTMFDNTDPLNIKELNSLVIREEYSTAEQDTRAILVSADKSMIAFPVNDRYLIYDYDASGVFNKVTEIKIDEGDAAWFEIRGLVIGDIFYVIGPNSINAYTISGDFKQAGSLAIDEGASSVNRWSYWGPPGIISPTDSGGDDPFASPVD